MAGPKPALAIFLCAKFDDHLPLLIASTENLRRHWAAEHPRDHPCGLGGAGPLKGLGSPLIERIEADIVIGQRGPGLHAD